MLTNSLLQFDAADLDNMLLLFQEIKAKDKDLLLSADTSAAPWIGADGQPSTDLSKHGEGAPDASSALSFSSADSSFSSVLDWILIMTYGTSFPSSRSAPADIFVPLLQTA